MPYFRVKVREEFEVEVLAEDPQDAVELVDEGAVIYGADEMVFRTVEADEVGE